MQPQAPNRQLPPLPLPALQLKVAAQKHYGRELHPVETSLIGAVAGGFTGMGCHSEHATSATSEQVSRRCTSYVLHVTTQKPRPPLDTPAGIVTTPLDVLKTRLMVQGASGQYKNLVDATIQVCMCVHTRLPVCARVAEAISCCCTAPCRVHAAPIAPDSTEHTVLTLNCMSAMSLIPY